MVSKLLKMASDEFSNQVCNDLPDDFYEGMSVEDIQEVYKEFHKWYNSIQEYDPNNLNYLGDNILILFFSEYIKTLKVGDYQE